MGEKTSIAEALKFPTKLNLWLTVAVSFTVIVNASLAVESRYAKQSDLKTLSTFTKISFAELNLEMTQERINRILAVPINDRAEWQRKELIRLQSIKENQLRRLNETR